MIVAVGDRSLTVKAPLTGDYKNYRRVNLGKIEISATGKVSVTVKALKEGWRPLNLRSLTLRPAE